MNQRPILPLTAEGFRPFGDVIEPRNTAEQINAGTTAKHAKLAALDLLAEGGEPSVSLYRADPYDFSQQVTLLERHPLSSQLFMPLEHTRLVVIVAPPAPEPDPAAVQAFVTSGIQGVNFHPGVWHHPCIVLDEPGWLLVLDRDADDENCDLYYFPNAEQPVFALPGNLAVGSRP